MKNGCPVCRNVNELTATQCRYCGAALTPPQPPLPVVVKHRRVWPLVLGATLVLLAVLGGAAFAFGGKQSAPAAVAAVALQAGTDTGTALKFDPAELTAPANAPLQIVFTNKAQVPHNMTFQPPIASKTKDQVASNQSETLEFTAPGPGSYKYVCTIHPGMEGTLVIK